MPVITPAMGTRVVGGQTWYRLVRSIALRSASELALVAVPDGANERLVVLKRLPPALATDPAAVEKFRVEARIAALLDHQAIVRVHEVVESASEDYYTMEYVRGGDLRQLMDALAQQKRTLPLDCVLLIAIELCGALDYAHHLTDAKGHPAPIIHRELSPSKVLLGTDGTVKLTGFAAPPVARTKPRRSRTESVGYTSPERCLGETMDSRSDLFALGVLLYELSSGERLFPEATTEYQVMTRIVRGDLPRPSEIRRAYPRELEAILMRTLARDPQQRYQSASELQAALESFLWSRWPTASTAALAKVVSGAFPEVESIAQGTGELARIDPDAEPVLWPGPVPLAKPYPLAGEPARVSTRELERMAPKQFPDASNVDIMLGRPGPKPRPPSERVTTVRLPADELAIPVEHDARDVDAFARAIDGRAPTTPAEPRTRTAAVNANILPPTRRQQPTAAQPLVKKTQEVVVLGTPGARPSPLDRPSARALAFDAAAQPRSEPVTEPPRGQYQRPEALDEHTPASADDERIIEQLRAKTRVPTPGAIGRVAITRVVTPIGLVRAEHARPPKPPPEPPTTLRVVEPAPPEPPPPPPPVATEPARPATAAELDLDQARVSWTLISTPAADPIDAVKQRLPSPPPSAITGRRWPVTTIFAIVCVVIIGVLASAWAIKRTVHAPGELPEVLAAQPAPPTELVVHMKRSEPAPPPPVEAKQVRTKPRVVAKKPEPSPAPRAAEPVKPAPVDPRRSLFPPTDPPQIATTLDPQSLDGIPYLQTIEVKGLAAEPAVRKAVGELLAPLRACYRYSARERKLAPQVPLTITFEIDRRRVPIKVRAVGGGPLDMLATCANQVTSDLRDLPAPTSGTVRVSVSLEFRPI